MKPYYAVFLVCGLLLAGAHTAHAQEGPEKGGNELEIWAGGGHDSNGIITRTGMVNTGLRYGWILTELHGPSILRGQFEYAVDAVPMFLVFQPGGTAYGAGVVPLGLIWDFQRRGNVVPYIEISSGPLFTSTDVPAGASRFNFMDSMALGFHFLTKKLTWTADVRFLHVSDAGITNPNPGINTVQVRIGVGWFTHGRR
ncbi:MAG: acyloxyacyl hydrolase [Candidatus Acidiferrales bacterium]